MNQERELVTQRGLSRILGFVKNSGYLAKLKKNGILRECFVQVEGRKHPLIDVEVAIREIEASEDPARDYVRQRWTDHRDKLHDGDSKKRSADNDDKTSSKNVRKESTGQATNKEAAPGKNDDKVVNFADARTRTEIFKAKKAELEYQEAAGKLVEKDKVQKTAANVGGLVREKLNSIPDRLSQVLAAETGPDKIHELLTKDINQVLHAIADRIERDLGVRPAA